MSTKEIHEKFMRSALDLGKIALENGDPPVGALIVINGEIVGRGIESGKSTNDVTNHAEILAVKDAIKNGHQNDLSRSTLYTTHEPCVMCSYLIRHHKISSIIFGSPVDFVGGHTSKFDLLNTQEVPKWGETPEVVGDVLKAECVALSAEFAALNRKK